MGTCNVIKITEAKQNMKNENLHYLILSLGICSGIMLVDRFIVTIPIWLLWPLIIISGISLAIFIVKRYKLIKR